MKLQSAMLVEDKRSERGKDGQKLVYVDYWNLIFVINCNIKGKK